MLDLTAFCNPPRRVHYSLRRTLLRVAAIAAAFSASVLAQTPLAFQAEVAARVLERVSAIRARQGLRALERDERLDQAAHAYAHYIAHTGTLDHRADGRTPAARVRERGYAHCVLSENIAFEYSSRGYTAESLARNFFEGWRDSRTHRENLLDPAVTQTGIGVARSAKGEYFAVQLFAQPALPGATRRRSCAR